MLEFLFFVSPILPVAASVPCTLFFFFFALGTVYYTYMACITDPMDVYLAKHLLETGEVRNNEQQTCCYRAPPSNPTEEEEEMKYCWVCETSVADHSMHCKYCNKCVSHFDHHCLWLNTCVGNGNYTYFYRILWSSCWMLLVHTCCMLGIVISVFASDGGVTQTRANHEWFGANLSGLVAGVNIFFIVSNVASLSAVAQLLVFHIGLQKKKMTTYQFIISDNARRREQFQKKEERRSNRVAAVSKAHQEGQPVLALRLRMGQYCCATCDPLPDEEAPADGHENGADKNETTLGYAELSDEVGGTSVDEKTSMTSERDLARTLAASLGESSSSQLEPMSIQSEQKQEANVISENSTEDVAEEESKQESDDSNDVKFVAVATAGASSHDVVTETSRNEAEDATENVSEGKVEDGEAKQEEPEWENAASDVDNI